MTGALLDGVRVIEIAHPHTEHAGRLLAGLGAEVVLVEGVDGATTRRRGPCMANAPDPTRAGIPFLARNLNKRSVVIDMATVEGQGRLEGLIERSDIVVSAAASPMHDAVLSARGDAARIAVTDEYGLGESGIVPYAASGAMACTGWPDKAPCNSPSWLAHDAAGIHAALMAVISLLQREVSGVRLDYEIPLHEAAIASIAPWTRHLHAAGVNVAGQGLNPGRCGFGPYPVFRVDDGWVKVIIATPKQWGAFVALLGSPDDLVDGPWADRAFRDQNADAFYPICEEYLAGRSVEDVFHSGQSLGLTVTPLYTMRQFRSDPHAEAREFFVEVDDPDHGVLEHLRAPMVSEPAELIAAASPAPALGADDAWVREVMAEPPRRISPTSATVDPARPLDGLRLLQLGSGAVVPESASIFASLGGDVVRVESKANPDFLRRGGFDGDLDRSPTFNQLNLSVRSIAVDLREPEGLELVTRLAIESDAVVENMRHPVVARWGLDYAGLQAMRPDAISLSSQGMGRGPYHEFQSFGPNLSAFSGATSQWAHPDDDVPVGPTVPHPDHVAGKQGFIALIAALRRRHLTGEGCFIEAAQVEAPAWLIADRFLAQSLTDSDLPPPGNSSPDMAPHGCYPCADDRWIALAVETDEQWRALAGALRVSAAEFATSTHRLARARELDGLVADWTTGQSVAVVEQALRAAGVPASRVVDGDDMAVADGHEPGGFFDTVEHPIEGLLPVTGIPVKTSDGRRPVVTAAPLMGEHTDAVLAEVLDLGEGELIDLRSTNKIGL